MSNLEDRLKAARKAAGYETAADAARAFGWNENTYRSHESGIRGVPRQSIVKYARAFKVSVDWLLTGRVDGMPPLTHSVAIRHLPLFDAAILPRSKFQLEEAVTGVASGAALAVPISLAGERSFAVKMPDDSMMGGLKNIHKGDWIIVDPDYAHAPGSYVLVYDPVLQQHTIRRWRLIGDGTAELAPTNNDYPTSKVPADTDLVLGCVRGRFEVF